MQQYVKEQGDTPLCNVNRGEKGTATLDEDQGEVPTVGEDQDTEKESDHPEHPSHAAPMDRVCRPRLAKSCGSRDDSLSWNLSRVKQGGAIRVDGTCSQCRMQVPKCGCLNCGNVINSERDGRL